MHEHDRRKASEPKRAATENKENTLPMDGSVLALVLGRERERERERVTYTVQYGDGGSGKQYTGYRAVHRVKV